MNPEITALAHSAAKKEIAAHTDRILKWTRTEPPPIGHHVQIVLTAATNELDRRLRETEAKLEVGKTALRSFLRSDGHNVGCSYDPDGNCPNSDYCSCNKSVSRAIAALTQP